MTKDRSTERTETDESTTERDEFTHEDAETYRPAGTSRRSFLQTTAAAGLVGLGVGSGAVGSAAAAGIPTPWLEVDGNLLRDPDGNKVILRGVNVIDPARAAKEWRKNIEPLIELATDPGKGWHAHVIRLPMQPQDIGDHGPGTAAPTPGFSQAELQNYLAEYVDPAVEAAEDVGAYIMLDYHRHYPEGPDWDSPELDEEIRLFWNEVAPRYSDRSHVIYELYNEPNTPYPGAGDPTDDVGVTDPRAEENYLYWRETAQPWVDLIREHASRNLIVIGSPRWSQFTYWAGEHEFEGDNLAYAGHVYAHENLRPLSTYFGEPSEEVPVFMSEFGYGTEGSPYLVGTNEVEGQQFLDLFDAHDIHWQAWCFDHTWSPGMLNRDYEVDSPHGRLFKERLREKRNDDLPASAGGGDETPPSAPSNLAVTETGSESVGLTWDAASDSGGSGLANYAVYLDGALDHRITAGTAATELSGLLPETTYEFAVSAVDGAGNESDRSGVVTATTDPPASERLVLNDFDGDPAWADSRNELGNWCGAGSFANDDGEVADGALVLEYDGGWLQSYVRQDVSSFSTLNLQVRGADGGEESAFAVELGGGGGVLAEITDDTIGTSFSTVSIDMAAAGMDASSPGAVYLDFWSGDGTSGTIEIDEIWFE